MTAIEELQTAVSSIAERVGPSIVGIGRGTRGSGVVIADGKVLTNAHNLRGDEVTVTFADGRSLRGTVAGWDGDGDLAVIDVDTAGATALEWGDGEALSVGTAVFGAGGQPRWRDPRDVRSRVGRRARVPRPGRPPDRRQRRAHRSAGAGLVRWRAARRRRASSSASTPTGSARASTSPCRPTPRCAPASMRSAVASRRSDRGSAWPSLPRTSPAGCAVRSASRSVTASWSVASRTTASPRRPGSRPATSSSRPAGKPITDADDLHTALATLELPFEVKLVRGTDERTVQVGGGTTATGEA